MLGSRRHRQRKLLSDQRDGRQRRSQLVRGRGCEPVQLGEVLLAREHQLGSGERVREPAGILGDLPRVQPDEGNREQNGEPDPRDIGRRQLQRGLAVPRQGVMHEHEEGCAGDRESSQHDGELR